MGIDGAQRSKATGTNDLITVPATEGSVAATPEHEEIAQRAYEISLARGGEHGHDLEDWLQAERELLERSAVSRAVSR